MKIESPLLRQLQQRLVTLASVDDAWQEDILALIALLFEAQQSGNGVINISDVSKSLGVDWIALQQQNQTIIGCEGSTAPVIAFQPFVAFRRVYHQLHEVSGALKKRNTFTPPSDKNLAQIHWEFVGGEISDEQRLAAFTAASMPFCLITGGAGTGKTTTLTKALELILLDHPDWDVFLSAPTGKAAQRLNESLSAQRNNVNDAVRDKLVGLQAKTLHSLLGISERTGRAHKNANNPLACQVLAIDEASMIGTDLLGQIIAALPTDAKLILLGDANQLPPINSVAFFNDVTRANISYTDEFVDSVHNKLGIDIEASAVTPLANQICRLTTAHRFAEKSVIELIADAILENQADTLVEVINDDLHSLESATTLYMQLAERYPHARQALLDEFPSRMILCANRQGQFGSDAINAFLDPIFRERICDSECADASDKIWYAGRKILIEKNHPDLRLSNGDIGCCCWSATRGEWVVDFSDARQLSVELLPNDYSLAFAMTIHKSQGSEYLHVDMILDRWKEEINPLVQPALIYTGVTRARQSLSLFSDIRLLHQTLQGDGDSSASPLLAVWGS